MTIGVGDLVRFVYFLHFKSNICQLKFSVMNIFSSYRKVTSLKMLG